MNSVKQSDLRRIREEGRINLRDLAKALGRKPATVRGIEMMEREPLWDGMRAWGRYLGMTGPQVRSLLVNCDRYDKELYDFMTDRYEKILSRHRKSFRERMAEKDEEMTELRKTLTATENLLRARK